MKIDLAITGVGLVSPVGHSALACMHAVRSDQSALTLLPIPDRVKEWVAGGKVAHWTSFGGHRHWAALGALAARQAWDHANAIRPLRPGSRVSLVVGRAEPVRPGPVFPSEDFDVHAWATDTLEFEPEHAEIIAAGSCSAQAGLRFAAHRFASGRAQSCLIGAIDSQAQLRAIRWHEDNLRLKCSYVTDGLMPSEAAAFLCVEPVELARRRGVPILAIAVAVVGGTELASVLSDLPNTATALTRTVESTLQQSGVGVNDIGMVWSDLNGESYRAREWAFTAVRLGVQSHTRLMHPADVHGDLGTATDTHLLGVAAMAFATRWCEQPALVFSGSDAGIRASTLLTRGSEDSGVVNVVGPRPRVLSVSFGMPPKPEEPGDFRDTDNPPRYWAIWHARHAHQDDIAGLYYQRRAMLEDADVPWTRLGESEDRLLRHIDAVVAGGADDMAFLAAGVESDEEGVAFGAAWLLGQIPSPQNLAIVERALSGAQGSQWRGLSQGLIHAPLGDALMAAAQSWLRSDSVALRALGRRLLTRGRVAGQPSVAGLDEALAVAETAIEIAEASWRLGWFEVVPRMKDLLANERVDVRQAALRALVCCVPSRAAVFCRSRLPDNDAFGGALATGLAICGEFDDQALLIRHVHAHPSDLDAIEALGIHGGARASMALIDLLESDAPGVAATADKALCLVSGQPSTRSGNQPRPDIWRRWFDIEGRKIEPTKRWRHGRHFVPSVCIDELADPSSSLRHRERAHAELCRWVGSTPVAYEADAFAAIQASDVARLRAQFGPVI